MVRKGWAFVVAAVAACTAGSAMAQNLTVGNPGFETAINYDVAAAPGNWLAFFGGPTSSMLSTLVSTTDPHTGAQNLATSITGGILSINAYTGVNQPVTGIQPGVSYSMKLWAKKIGNAFNGVEYRIEWYDSAGAVIGNQFALTQEIHASLTTTYQQFSLQAVAPAGSAKAVLVLAVQTFLNDGTNVDTTVAWDDISFGADPLPTQQACCVSDGSCVVALLNQCPAGTIPSAVGATCVPNTCPAPAVLGACCNRTTAACVAVSSTNCSALGGNYLGDNTVCSPNNCPTASGACCNGTTCVVKVQALCTGTGAAYLGNGTVCNPTVRSGSINVCCKADFNNAGGVSVQDIFDFLSAWFAKCP